MGRMHNINLMLQFGSVVHNTLCASCVNIYLCMLQRQQYPQLPEAMIKTKALIWKVCDEKEQERRQAFYRDVLGQQQSVSNFYKCVCVCVHVHICTNSLSHV